MKRLLQIKQIEQGKVFTVSVAEQRLMNVSDLLETLNFTSVKVDVTNCILKLRRYSK